MFIARIVFFKLHESPRYLVHAGRHEEAAEALQLISKYNGSERQFAVEDVEDTVPAVPPEPDAERTAKSAHILEHSTDGLRDGSLDSVTYQTMDEPDVTLDAHRFGTPLIPDAPPAFAREAHPRPVPARRRSASTASLSSTGAPGLSASSSCASSPRRSSASSTSGSLASCALPTNVAKCIASACRARTARAIARPSAGEACSAESGLVEFGVCTSCKVVSE